LPDLKADTSGTPDTRDPLDTSDPLDNPDTPDNPDTLDNLTHPTHPILSGDTLGEFASQA
jgi:hypothetical protein